jgi:hypothetical protein
MTQWRKSTPSGVSSRGEKWNKKRKWRSDQATLDRIEQQQRDGQEAADIEHRIEQQEMEREFAEQRRKSGGGGLSLNNRTQERGASP